MDNQRVFKQGEDSSSLKKQNLKRKDPRLDVGNDSDSNDEGEYNSQKDEITDLDIAYSILYDEMKKEYICEKDRTRERREGDKAAIPQRVFQSFLLSMENDINEYSDNINYHKQLLKEERKLKISIESNRKHLIRDKKENGVEKSKVVELKEKHAQLKKRVKTLKKAKDVTEKVKRLLQNEQVTFAIPTIPITQQINSYELLQGLNDSIENKLKILSQNKQ